MTEASRRKAHVVRDFNDIGTGASFEEGASHLLDAGTFENYRAAGLISETAAAPAVAKAAAPKKRKSSRKGSRKAVTTSPATSSTAPSSSTPSSKPIIVSGGSPVELDA